MSQPVSDAAVELLAACPHFLHFSFGTPVGYPYAAAQPDHDHPPQVLFRRVQVASPPPGRDGEAWHVGLESDKRPFNPKTFTGPLSLVRPQEGAISLDLPDPENILLDWWFSVPRDRQVMTFPGPDRDLCVSSVPYWSPASSGETVTRTVDYFVTHRLKWTTPPEKGSWIAISFDAFCPPERDSADLIARIGDCDCPS
jgi:hypothetical protein